MFGEDRVLFRVFAGLLSFLMTISVGIVRYYVDQRTDGTIKIVHSER